MRSIPYRSECPDIKLIISIRRDIFVQHAHTHKCTCVHSQHSLNQSLLSLLLIAFDWRGHFMWPPPTRSGQRTLSTRASNSNEEGMGSELPLDRPHASIGTRHVKTEIIPCRFHYKFNTLRKYINHARPGSAMGAEFRGGRSMKRGGGAFSEAFMGNTRVQARRDLDQTHVQSTDVAWLMLLPVTI